MHFAQITICFKFFFKSTPFTHTGVNRKKSVTSRSPLSNRSKIITKIRYNNDKSVINCSSVILNPVCTRESPAEFPKRGMGDLAKKDSSQSLNPTPDIPQCGPGELIGMLQSNCRDFFNYSTCPRHTVDRTNYRGFSNSVTCLLDPRLCPPVNLDSWGAY